MNERDLVRYDSRFFPGDMCEATVSWGDNFSIVSHVDNYSAHGVRVSISPLPGPLEIPKKKDIIKVYVPIAQMWFTGMCVFATNDQDGSVSMGIYFYKPEEQNYLEKLLFKSLDAPSCPSGYFVSYEWEERVDRLCHSEDPVLKKIGEEKLRSLRQKRKYESPVV